MLFRSLSRREAERLDALLEALALGHESELLLKQILARKSEVLAEKLRLFMVQQVEEKGARIKTLARTALPPPAALCATLQINMRHEVSVHEHLEACIHDVEIAIAHHLAPTPGAMLTTVPGIGVTLAAELYAELGDPGRQRCLKRLSSYAGLVARLKQTGGPDKEAQTRGRSRRAGEIGRAHV